MTAPLNITILHNSYQQRGGEDAVVDAEAELLRNAGHKVHVEIVSNSTIRSFTDKVATFARTPYDQRRYSWALELFGTTNPDVVHVHNFFPLLTPAVLAAGRQYGAAVIQTLHNYRLLCAAATFFRDGHSCEKCLSGSEMWGVVHRCYRGSLPGSLSIALMQRRARAQQTWWRDVDAFISLTQFSRAKFEAGGLPADRILVKPNFVARRRVVPQMRHGALFVGRLSEEKGLRTLLAAWQSLPGIPLKVIGDGPLREALQGTAPANVSFVGKLPREAIDLAMAESAFLVVPSLWYEGFPMVILEAYANRLPVVASRLGSLREIVDEGKTGRLFEAGSSGSLAEVVGELLSEPPKTRQLGENAAAVFEELYSPERNLTLLEQVYTEAIARARTPVRPSDNFRHAKVRP